MTTEQVQRFEAVAGRAMDEHGYARAAEPSSAALEEHAALMRERFRHYVRSHGLPGAEAIA